MKSNYESQMPTSEDWVKQDRTKEFVWLASGHMDLDCPTTSCVLVKLEVFTGNGDRLSEVNWKSSQNLKWPEHAVYEEILAESYFGEYVVCCATASIKSA